VITDLIRSMSEGGTNKDGVNTGIMRLFRIVIPPIDGY
jgi:hypothetical protein